MRDTDEILDEIRARQLITPAKYACATHGADLVEMAQPLRRKQGSAAGARVSFYVYLRGLGWSLQEIGELFGIGHAAVSMSIKRWSARAKRDAMKRSEQCTTS